MFMDSVKSKALPIVAIAGATIALIFLLLWQNTQEDLAESNRKLTKAENAIVEYEQTVTTLKRDAEVKSDQNFKLAVTLSVLQDDYAIDVKLLREKIAELEKRKPKSIIVVDTKNYVEEAYVKDVNTTVLSSMWVTYCRVSKKCPEEASK